MMIEPFAISLSRHRPWINLNDLDGSIIMIVEVT